MFGFFKKKENVVKFDTGEALARATVMTSAVILWRRASRDAYEPPDNFRPEWFGGYRGESYWTNAMELFIKYCCEGHDIPQASYDEMKQKCDFYLNFINDGYLRTPIRMGHFTDLELQQVGEFFAAATLGGLQAALVSDSERAAIIIDYLPADWLEKSGIDVARFDSWYADMTGKKRKRRLL